MGAESSPKIVIVDESPVRARSSRRLREAGFTGVVHISEMQSLVARIYARPLALFDLVIAQRDIRQLSLTVDWLRYVVKKRKRLGLASTFLAEPIKLGDQVKVYVQKAHGFALPPDPKTPITYSSWTQFHANPPQIWTNKILGPIRRGEFLTAIGVGKSIRIAICELALHPFANSIPLSPMERWRSIMRQLSAEARLHFHARSLSGRTERGFHAAALYGAFALIAAIVFGTLSVHPF